MNQYLTAKNLGIAAIVLVLLSLIGGQVAMFVFLRDLSRPAVPAPVMPVIAAVDLRAAFAVQSDAALRKQHAGDAREIFAHVRDAIAWDNQRTARAFRSGSHIDNHVVVVREFLLRDWAFRDHYPAFGEAVAAHLKLRLGDQLQGDLTDATRAAWVQALEELEQGCAAVERGT